MPFTGKEKNAFKHFILKIDIFLYIQLNFVFIRTTIDQVIELQYYISFGFIFFV